jgi:uncharacterized Fe-S cluster-containing protein
MDIKKRYPNAKTVFVGPCVAKKDEADHYKGIVDAVLTFDELSVWLKEKNIELERNIDITEESRARFFPTTGGILKSLSKQHPDYTYMALDGVENCIAALRDIASGKIHKCFIEMSACVGSCIGGPVMEKYHKSSPIDDYIKVSKYAGKKDFVVEQPNKNDIRKLFKYIDPKYKKPSETEIYSALRQMGKFKESDELNCGSCGYNTCREKAIAICHGKSDASSCLPFLKDKAESFSDTIVKNTPNGIIVLNENMEVQQINEAAKNIMNIRSSADVLGDQVVKILDPHEFIRTRDSKKNIRKKRLFLAEYQKYIELTVLHDRDSHLLIGIMRDITEEEYTRVKKEEISRKTIAVADKVVDRQMKIVQEIASLLGETAAETKIALTKLKESISDE